jgi:hypothetical protein
MSQWFPHMSPWMKYCRMLVVCPCRRVSRCTDFTWSPKLLRSAVFTNSVEYCPGHRCFKLSKFHHDHAWPCNITALISSDFYSHQLCHLHIMLNVELSWGIRSLLNRIVTLLLQVMSLLCWYVAHYQNSLILLFNHCCDSLQLSVVLQICCVEPLWHIFHLEVLPGHPVSLGQHMCPFLASHGWL